MAAGGHRGATPLEYLVEYVRHGPLIVIDPAGAATVTLPGKAGASEAFASLPFAEADLASLPALMAALKGASVSVETPRKLAGSIVSASTETLKDKGGDERQITRVSLLNGATVEQFVLEDAEGMKFDDTRLGAQVDTALKALRAAHDRSGRDIAIRLAAGGKRTVRLGYVAVHVTSSTPGAADFFKSEKLARKTSTLM